MSDTQKLEAVKELLHAYEKKANRLISEAEEMKAGVFTAEYFQRREKKAKAQAYLSMVSDIRVEAQL